MSLQSTACRPKAAPASPAPRLPGSRPHPAHYQAHGRLYRAIVSLPDSMCERDRPLQERWVFFDCPGNTNPGERLEALLALAWNTDTTSWCDIGLIYNVSEASELIAQVFGAEVGSHARSAFGVAQIPLGACVEIEMIAEIA